MGLPDKRFATSSSNTKLSTGLLADSGGLVSGLSCIDFGSFFFESWKGPKNDPDVTFPETSIGVITFGLPKIVARASLSGFPMNCGPETEAVRVAFDSNDHESAVGGFQRRLSFTANSTSGNVLEKSLKNKMYSPSSTKIGSLGVSRKL